ncbi:MAG TPA: T9SS type A sorting domain-containing protein [Chitinophagales bacterium]|nr:T9SS type A sorting domain-containing protein [Chitinophagales bacterium]
MKSLSTIFFITIFSVAAFGQDGTLDSTFGINGKIMIPFLAYPPAGCTSEALQPDGKILIAGYDTSLSCILMRLNSDGSPDYSFGNNSYTTLHFAYENVIQNIKLQADGKIVAAISYGSGFYNYRFAVARYLTNGVLDSSFANDGVDTTDFGGTGSRTSSLAIQPDGKIVAVGYRYTADPDVVLARYNTNGSLDTSFNTTGKVITALGPRGDFSQAIALQYDGKILVTGGTYTSDTTGDYFVMRYLANGALDNSFGVNGIVQGTYGGYWEHANGIVEQPDGKIVFAGSTNISPNNFNWTLMRLLPDGTPDNSFGTNGLVITDFADSLDIAAGICLQPNGKIIEAGNATITNEQSDVAVLRYNTDGSFDSTFGTNGIVTTDFSGGDDGGSRVLLQSDGRIVVCGNSRSQADNIYSFIVCRYLNDEGIHGNDFVSDLNLGSNCSFYPNPLHQAETLSYTLTKNELLTISLYDVNGKQIRNFISNEQRTAGTHKEMLSIGELTSGNYFLTISNGSQKMTVKMVKQ